MRALVGANYSQVLIAIAQVASGGFIVQLLLFMLRRRSELRQLDKQSDSTAVETMERVIGALERQLGDARTEITRMRNDALERDMQIKRLADHLTAAQTDLAVAKAEVARLRFTLEARQANQPPHAPPGTAPGL